MNIKLKKKNTKNKLHIRLKEEKVSCSNKEKPKSQFKPSITVLKEERKQMRNELRLKKKDKEKRGKKNKKEEN